MTLHGTKTEDRLKKIVIEQGISSIGDYAFYQATRLLSISIPSTVKTVGERAFYRCTSLTSGTVWLIDWNLCKGTGEITFTGKGEMQPFPYSYDTPRHEPVIGTPWYSVNDLIEKVILSVRIPPFGGHTPSQTVCH